MEGIANQAPAPAPAVKGYTALSAEQVGLMNEVKSMGHDLDMLIEKIKLMGADPRSVALACTHLQTGAMWLNRSIAKPTTFF